VPDIHILDQHVADLIAAGEVVERPASVVKELMENSIDAGASIITVEITAGGMTFIRVTDNGCGISQKDAGTAFLRHATSKLHDPKGLESIGTLGFRGEALAAIAAVSRIELLTREHGAKEGVSLILEAGDIVDISPAGCPEGTTILVRDLFFNTPARQKFLKSDRSEGSGVSSAVLRCALSRPCVSFRFIKDGKTEYHTPGDSRLDSCIYSLLGRDFSNGLLSAETSDETVSVGGYISAPDSARGNRSYQFFFVNGRPVRSVILQAALEQAFKNTLPTGRYPSCVLHITTRLSDIDVNVHPAKAEVKFASDKQVFDGVYYAALGALERSQSPIIADDGRADDFVQLRTAFAERDAVIPGSGKESWKTSGSRSGYESSFKSMQVAEFQKAYGTVGAVNSRKTNPVAYDQPQSAGVALFSSESYKVIGEALGVYIIVEYHDSVWFIDKHAAHERLHYDALVSGSYTPMSEALITPVICRLGHEDVSLLLENAEFLDKLGFSVESFGDDAAAVRHIPSDIEISDTESILSDICSELKHSGNVQPVQRDTIFKMFACKAAIKSGSSSVLHELESLTARVMSGEVSYCPHGRPVAFELTKAVLDKSFKRI